MGLLKAPSLEMNIEKLKPLNGRVTLKVMDETEKMKGLIHLPDASQEKSNIGVIVRVGEESNVKVGDKVMFSKYAGTTIEKEKNEYRLILEKDLLGVFDEEGN